MCYICEVEAKGSGSPEETKREERALNTTEIKTVASDKPARKSSAEAAGKVFRITGKIIFTIVKYTLKACLWVVKGILCLFGIVIGSAADTAEAEYRYEEFGEYM